MYLIIGNKIYKYIYYNKQRMISLVGQNLKALTQQQFQKQSNVSHLDVSCNQLSQGIQFKPWANLITLVIDQNRFTVLTDFPVFKKLQTFSANKNDFSDLQLFLDQGYDRFPNLINLSLLKNPLNPFFEGEDKYEIYRDKILQNFSKLQTIDGCAVSIIKKQIKKKQKMEEQNYEKLQGVATYDHRLANEQLKSVKTRSEGHRFVKNNQL